MLVSTTCFYSVEINVCGEYQRTAAAVHVYLLLWWQDYKMKKWKDVKVFVSLLRIPRGEKSICFVLKTNIFGIKRGAF